MASFSKRNAPVATTMSGRVRGKLKAKGTMAVFSGIPYAAPPVGDLRWRPPAPVQPWSDTRACTKLGAFAYQRATIIDDLVDTLVNGLGLGTTRARSLKTALKLMPVKQSEDCLTLNVRAPSHAQNLPVMVWIHGGDHTDGSAGEIQYQGNALPERGCVLVTINYRLGLFGFFAHPDLSAESPDDVSGNYGLLDQIAALEWVRDNIANFGGDPSRITIFGESAGGQAVLNLLTAPRARGLFHRAIAQSPSDSGRWLHLRRPALDFRPAEEVGVEFGTLAVGSADGQLRRLRAAEPDDLSELYREHSEFGRYFFPVVDDVILPSTPMSAFSDELQAAVPLMIGYNADEGSILAGIMHPAGAEFEAPTDSVISAADVRATFGRSYPSAAHVDRLMDTYPGLDRLATDAVLAHAGDHMFGVHVDHASRRHAEAGHPVYRYHFRALPPSAKQTVGAFHAAEIFYVFDTHVPLVPVADDAHLLTREMGDRWFAFAATGVPDSPGRESWPIYDSGDPQHMVFDRPLSGVQACPPQAGLDLMRERIAWLTDELRATNDESGAGFGSDTEPATV